MKLDERMRMAVKLLKEHSGYVKNERHDDVVKFDFKVEHKTSKTQIIVFPVDKTDVAFYWCDYITKMTDMLGLYFYVVISEGQIQGRIYGYV